MRARPDVRIDPATTYFHVNLNLIHRLLALIEQIHKGLEILMQIVKKPVDVFDVNLEAQTWKERILTKLVIEIIPALGVLSRELHGTLRLA